MNYLFLLRQITIMLMLIMGVTIEYVCGDLDLTFAAQIAASSLLGVFVAIKGAPVIISFIIVILFNVISGIAKAVLTVKLEIPSVIATLGMQMVLVNLCSGIMNDTNLTMNRFKIIYSENCVLEIGAGLAVVGLLAVYLFFEKTYYGRYCRMLGDNLALAKTSGVRCLEISAIIHTTASIYISVPAILLMLYTGCGSSALGTNYLYEVLTAVFLGQKIARKKNNVLGILCGTFIVVTGTWILTTAGNLNQLESIMEGVIILICSATG